MLKENSRIFILVCFFLILFLLAYGDRTGTGGIDSITIEDFDLNIARSMIQEIERPILNFTSGAVLTRSELEELMIYHVHSPEGSVRSMILSSFFDFTEWEDMSVQEFEVLEHVRFLTIFDDDIDVTKAYIETTTFRGRDIAYARVELHIILEYIGEDTDMIRLLNPFAGHRDYVRKYRFRPNDIEIWGLDWVPNDMEGWVLDWVPMSGLGIFSIHDSWIN